MRTLARLCCCQPAPQNRQLPTAQLQLLADRCHVHCDLQRTLAAAMRCLAALLLLAAAAAPCAPAAAAAASTLELPALKASALGMSDWLTAVRREFHQWPELLWQEHNTSARIRQHLAELGIPFQHPFAKTGVVGRIGSGPPVVALRADIDALPVTEPEGLEYGSRNPGRMHACGHDGAFQRAAAARSYAAQLCVCARAHAPAGRCSACGWRHSAPACSPAC